MSRPVLGPIQLPTQWVAGVKWLGHEASHLFRLNAQNGNSEVPVYFLKVKQVYTIRKME
jgi:hypothetical protein